MPTAEFTVKVAADDITCLVTAADINHGRDDTNTQPEPASCTLDLLLLDEVLPATVEVGAMVTVDAAPPAGGSSRRFAGRITDIALGWEDAGRETPNTGTGQVVCVGTMADLGRRIIGDTPWPAELDGARVSRIMTAAGATLDPAYSDPGTVQILARDVDAQPALDLARDTADSAGGMLWHTRSGEVRYADAQHRRGVPIGVDLDACDIEVTPTWRRTTEGLINQVSVSYGVAPGGGEQPRYTAQRNDSLARYGIYGASITTVLSTLADATALGQMLLVRNGSPVWVMAALPLDLDDIDATRYTALLALDIHALVNLTGLPAIGSTPTSAVLWVEGWREHIEYGIHTMELVVSGYCRTAPAPRWDDVDPAWTWDTLPATLTWDAATCLGPMPNRGRWNDAPASLRWDQVPATVTWDTWDAYATTPTTAMEATYA